MLATPCGNGCRLTLRFVALLIAAGCTRLRWGLVARAGTVDACIEDSDDTVIDVEEGLSLLQRNAWYPYTSYRRAPSPAELPSAQSSDVQAGDSAALAELQRWSDIAVAEDLQRLTQLLRRPQEPEALIQGQAQSHSQFLQDEMRPEEDVEEASKALRPAPLLLDERRVGRTRSVSAPADEFPVRQARAEPSPSFRRADFDAPLPGAELNAELDRLAAELPPAGSNEEAAFLAGLSARRPAAREELLTAADDPRLMPIGLAADRRYSTGAIRGRMDPDAAVLEALQISSGALADPTEDPDSNASLPEPESGEESAGGTQDAVGAARDALGTATARAQDALGAVSGHLGAVSGNATSAFSKMLTFGDEVSQAAGVAIWLVMLLTFLSCCCCCICYLRRGRRAA